MTDPNSVREWADQVFGELRALNSNIEGADPVGQFNAAIRWACEQVIEAGWYVSVDRDEVLRALHFAHLRARAKLEEILKEGEK